MPTISVKRDLLYKRLGKYYSEDEFGLILFEYGLELDEVTSEKYMLSKEQGENSSLLAKASEDIIYKIDVPANRYDLLCLEGLLQGLKVFLRMAMIPKFFASPPYGDIPMTQLFVKAATESIRPYAVAAILRNVDLNKDKYDSFMDLQEKLHQNIARKRTLVAIGTHDLDTIEGPFYYDAKPPKDIKFVPLNQNKEYNGDEIMELYADHPQLKQYLPIIKNSSVYPVITDSKGVVLSLPPIINGNHSKITPFTKNIFIECTATDLNKAKIVLDTLVCMFSEHVEPIKYKSELVEVVYHDGKKMKCPELEYRMETISVAKVNATIGIQKDSETIIQLLERMGFNAENAICPGKLEVIIPPTRHDIIHVVDIYEEVAIGYGYNSIPRSLPKSMTIARQNPLNRLCEMLRYPIAQAGFTETLSFVLCSKKEISTNLIIDFPITPSIQITNPKSKDLEVCRTTLIPCILKTVAANKKSPLPLKLFEIGDVVVTDGESETGAINERRLVAVHCNKSAGFEIIHGLLDRVMVLLDVPWSKELDYHSYSLKECIDPAFFPGRCANVFCKGRHVGKMGVMHPDVLAAYDCTNPCAVLELNLEHFL